MPEASFKRYGGSAPESYERFFVPVIAEPLANELLELAALRPNDRVLDVSCGTGIVARLARARIGDGGGVAGLDPNPGMLGVARAVAPAGTQIDWHEAGAEAMPLPDDAFDVVLCQMGLQFVPDKVSALREMRRVLAPGGRLVINVVGPVPGPFAVLAEALARHVSPQASGFVMVVFSLHDEGELRRLLEDAGIEGATVRTRTRTLKLPPPEEFLWQYVHSTPLAATVAQLDEAQRAALERDVVAKWRGSVEEGGLKLEVDVVEITARK